MSEQSEKRPVFESVHELADHLGISRAYAYVALKNGTIPSIKLGKRFVIPRAAIKAWLASAGGKLDQRATEDALAAKGI